MNYVYYTFKNDEPNKAYIGMTKYRVDSPKKYKGGGSYLHRAFKKYGRENFTRIDLGGFINRDEAHYWEGFYIKLYKTEVKYGGYNIIENGGTYGPYGPMSESTRKAISAGCKGMKMPQSQINSTIARMTKSNPIHRITHPKGMKGKHHSEETKEHLSSKLKNRDFSESHLNNLSKSTIEAHKIKVQCPHCGKYVTRNVINRWHNGNCKWKY